MYEVRRPSWWMAGATALALMMLSGCSTNHLYFSTYTKVGLDVSTTDGQMVNGTFGYKRFEGAIIPVDPEKLDADGKPQIASVFAGIAIKNSWLDGLDIAQVFGTGKAAAALAAQSTSMREILSLGAPATDQPGKQAEEK
jgi:hypothetical protein